MDFGFVFVRENGNDGGGVVGNEEFYVEEDKK